MNVIWRGASVGNALSPPSLYVMSIFTCDGGLKIVHYCLYKPYMYEIAIIE